MIAELTLRNRNGKELYAIRQQGTADNLPLLFCHGLGEHIGRYTHVFDYFCRAGFSCFGYDHQGHGKSYGEKGHVINFADYRSDLDFMIDYVRSETGKDEIILIAHSMGGLIALGYAIRDPKKLNKLIVTSPGILPKIPVPKIKDSIGRLFGKLIPTLTQANGLDVNGLAKKADVKEKYLADPLVHDRASAGWYLAWMEESQFVRSHAKISIPTLIMTGLADGIIDSESIINFYQQLSCEGKELK
ncbi:MAG: lysophospholipase, partial [Calditrichaeota bacterium]|nr:lysophospholipase [Calditrichota bacterium]